jgi:predicted secreted protein with PEFG-CTERM motif
MNTRTSYVAIAIIAAVITISVPAAFGQGFKEQACPDCPGGTGLTQNRELRQADIPITIWTDKAVYDHDSKIMVEGKVSNIKSGTQIGLVVIGPPPFNNIVAIDQIKVGSDGKYKTTLNTAGGSWKYDGTYTIKVTYGNQQINNKALVELTGGVAKVSKCATGELAANGQCVPFSITGGTVTSAMFSSESKSLTINISSFNDGMITVNPSTDAIRGIFMVLVDDEEWDDVEINGNQVTVNFPAGTDKIEIIGTFAIPEFGTIAALILAVAIISIIVVSSRTRLNVLPKY